MPNGRLTHLSVPLAHRSPRHNVCHLILLYVSFFLLCLTFMVLCYSQTIALATIFLPSYPELGYTVLKTPMDFLDPKKKRAHLIRLYVGYALMAIALITGTLILVYQTTGYGVDPKTGTIIQNGLVFIDSHLESSTVYINGENKGQTDTRLFLPSGKYDLELKKDGYRSWQRPFDLEGGKVARFVYPFLFPENLITKDVEIYGTAPGMASSSPDKHWLVVQQPSSLLNFEVVNLIDRANPITTIALPGDIFTTTGATHKLEPVEWSTDNRHLLLQHSFEGGSEFVVLDRETPAESINLNKLFEVPITSANLRDKRPDQFYLYDASGKVVRTADSKHKVTTPILSRVISYRSYGANVILYVTDETAVAGKVNVNLWDNGIVYTLRQLPLSNSYLLDLTKFDGKWYMAAGEETEQKTYVYKDAFNDLRSVPVKIPVPVSVLKVKTPQYISFSTNARFIAVQGGSEFAVYDAENNDQFRYDIKQPLLAAQKALWMDGHRLVVISQGKVVVHDFDGTNIQILSDANPAYPIFFNQGYDAMFTIANSRQVSLKPALIRTELKVVPAGQ